MRNTVLLEIYWAKHPSRQEACTKEAVSHPPCNGDQRNQEKDVLANSWPSLHPDHRMILRYRLQIILSSWISFKLYKNSVNEIQVFIKSSHCRAKRPDHWLISKYIMHTQHFQREYVLYHFIHANSVNSFQITTGSWIPTTEDTQRNILSYEKETVAPSTIFFILLTVEVWWTHNIVVSCMIHPWISIK